MCPRSQWGPLPQLNVCCCAGVDGHRIGDAVMGLAPGCLGHSVVVPAQLLVAMPPRLGFQEACTTPTVYITVQAAFLQGAHLRPGTKASWPLQMRCSCHVVLKWCTPPTSCSAPLRAATAWGTCPAWRPPSWPPERPRT